MLLIVILLVVGLFLGFGGVLINESVMNVYLILE